MILRITSSLIALAFLFACKKPSQPTPTNSLTTDVYTVGIVNNGPGSNAACYWKNEKPIILGVSGVSSYASDIAAVNNDVYVVGAAAQSGNSNFRAAIWKNGILKVLTTTQGYASSVTVTNGIAYVVGEYFDANSNLKAFLWNSTTDAMVSLDLGNFSSSAFDIKYQSGEQLIVGYINSQGALWKNGVASIITDPNFSSSYISGVAASGGNYYLLGHRNPINNGSTQYGFWKQSNGTTTFTDILNYDPLAIANKIAIKSDTLLLVGRTTNGWNAVLTKINTTNNTYSTVSLLTNSSEATDIFVDGNDIYVLIYDYSNNSATKVRYWKNGEIKTLETPTGFIHTEPKGIFVHKY